MTTFANKKLYKHGCYVILVTYEGFVRIFSKIYCFPWLPICSPSTLWGSKKLLRTPHVISQKLNQKYESHLMSSLGKILRKVPKTG